VVDTADSQPMADRDNKWVEMGLIDTKQGRMIGNNTELVEAVVEETKTLLYS
jgi:hypothetical protein